VNTLYEYGRMAEDDVRVEGYLKALQRVIRPGDRVLEIGSGPGIFSIAAAKMGASKVFAVEPSFAVNYGPLLARENGVGDRVEFFRGLSQNLVLDCQVDVVVSDLRGALPLFNRHLPTLKDARVRLLKPGGVMIPLEDTIFAAPVDDPMVECLIDRPWRNNLFGLNLEALADVEMSRVWRSRLEPSAIKSPPSLLARINYQAINDFGFSSSVEWELRDHCQVSGIGLWFDGLLAHEVAISNHPSAKHAIYGQSVLPIGKINCLPGSRIAAEISAKFTGSTYIWQWTIRIFDPDGSCISEASRNSMDFPGNWPEVTALSVN